MVSCFTNTSLKQFNLEKVVIGKILFNFQTLHWGDEHNHGHLWHHKQEYGHPFQNHGNNYNHELRHNLVILTNK